MRPDGTLPDGYRIELARRDHLRALRRIEREAGRLFVGLVPDEVVNAQSSPEDLEAALDAGRLWVALTVDGEPAGFAMAGVLGASVHLEEVDVHPSHGRRGLGAALVRTVCDWARREGQPAVTLTTYVDIPWNAPFYAQLGFTRMRGEDLDEELLELVREEAERGLEPKRRVVMRFETGLG